MAVMESLDLKKGYWFSFFNPRFLLGLWEGFFQHDLFIWCYKQVLEPFSRDSQDLETDIQRMLKEGYRIGRKSPFELSLTLSEKFVSRLGKLYVLKSL